MGVERHTDWRVCKVGTWDGANWQLDAVTDVRVEPPFHCHADIVSDGITGHCSCSVCGKAIDWWDSFCRHCGRRVMKRRTDED